MNDDEPSRSREGPMIALLLLAVVVLDPPQRVLRGRRVRARPFAQGPPADRRRRGQARRRDRGGDDGRPLALPVGGAGRDHAHLAGPRLPRRAGDRLAARGPVRRGGAALGLDDGLDHARVPDHDVDPHHVRRAGPEDLRDPEGGARRPLVRAAAAALHADLPPVHRRAERRVERDPAPARRPDLGPARRRRDAGGAAGADPGVADRRQARPERGRACSPASSTCTSSRRAR